MSDAVNKIGRQQNNIRNAGSLITAVSCYIMGAITYLLNISFLFSYICAILLGMAFVFLFYFTINYLIFKSAIPEDFMARWKEVIKNDPEFKSHISRRLAKIEEIIRSKKEEQSKDTGTKY